MRPSIISVLNQKCGVNLNPSSTYWEFAMKHRVTPLSSAYWVSRPVKQQHLIPRETMSINILLVPGSDLGGRHL